jgi:hypothetical protein
MSSIPLPALNVRPPEQTDPTAQYVRLSELMNQRALNAQQVQGAQLENQQRQLALQDQQAQTAAMHQWDGKSLDDLPGLILKNGGSANAVFGARNQILSQKTALTKLDTDTLANTAKKNDMLLGKLQSVTAGDDQGLSQRLSSAIQDSVQSGLVDPQHAQAVAQLANLPPDQLRSQLGIFEKNFMGQAAQFEQENSRRKTAAEESTANAKQLTAQTEAGRFQAQQNPASPLYSPTGAAVSLGASQGNPTMQAIQTGEAKQAGAKAGAEAAARFPYELQLKQQEMAGNPVFAVNPKTGQRELTTAGEAKQQGFTNPVKVTQAQVESETTLNAQLNDLQLNTSRYKAALNAMGPLSKTDVANMSHILSDPNVNSGIMNNIGMPAVVSMMEQGSKARDWNALSPDKQDALIGALRMKNSALLFQKVSTGMGRASKEAMDIEISNMPSPLEGATVGNKKLQSFQENIDQMASRSVKLPWQSDSKDVKARIEGQAVQQYNERQANTGQFAGGRSYVVGKGSTQPQVGDQVIINNKSLKVRKVYPNGTFDVESGAPAPIRPAGGSITQ